MVYLDWVDESVDPDAGDAADDAAEGESAVVLVVAVGCAVPLPSDSVARRAAILCFSRARQEIQTDLFHHDVLTCLR